MVQYHTVPNFRMALLFKNEFSFCKHILKRNHCISASYVIKNIDFEGHRRPYSIGNKPSVYSANREEIESEVNEFPTIINYFKDHRILYNCFIQSHKLNLPHYVRQKLHSKMINSKKRRAFWSSVPVIVERIQQQKEKSLDAAIEEKETTHQISALDKPQSFPFAKFDNVNIVHIPTDRSEYPQFISPPHKVSVEDDLAVRLKAYNAKAKVVTSFPQIETHADVSELRIYKDTLLSDLSEKETSVTQYGKPDSNIPKSDVPCGGCGELLHCQDEGLPGYIPSENFCGKDRGQLRSVVCQRCFFLKRYNTALNVRISPDVYEKALVPITRSRAMVMVVVDLLDVPCSIWSGLFDLIGTRRPVVVVGNKIDLLPLDNKDYQSTIKAAFVGCLKETSLWKANIRHVCLVSAKTGYGIEDLVTEIQVHWGTTDDIYLVGCTNAGKSSLFNALLGSDLCRVEASSLIRRATSSPWPGTTLNLLKFPLLRPSGKRLFDRQRRLSEEPTRRRAEALSKMGPPQQGRTLAGHIGQTFSVRTAEEELVDPFKVNAEKIVKERSTFMGINAAKEPYIDAKWCYDTPGTVQPDQLLGLLTHDELVDVLPRMPIEPRTFSLRNSQTLLLGGLVRLDLLHSPAGVRVSVCCSSAVPVTILATCEASSVHRAYLGTELLGVPRGGEARLAQWPPLKPVDVRLLGKGLESAAADVVLSSAGFITICGAEDEEIDLRGWTPGARGVYVRIPSMLPFTSKIKGKRVRGTPTYYNRQLSFRAQGLI